METLAEILFGSESTQAYMSAQIIGFFGFISMAMIHLYTRTDKTTPLTFNYWIKDNWPLIVLLFIGMYVGLRWQADIIEGIQTSSEKFSFIKDKWAWFFVGGFLLRFLVQEANSLIKRIINKKAE